TALTVLLARLCKAEAGPVVIVRATKTALPAFILEAVARRLTFAAGTPAGLGSLLPAMPGAAGLFILVAGLSHAATVLFLERKRPAGSFLAPSPLVPVVLFPLAPVLLSHVGSP